MNTRVLLTGAATLLGAEVLRELLRSEVEAILLLMPDEEPMRRRDLDRLAAYLGAIPGSVKTVAGDLRLPRFGLSMAGWEELAESFDIGFHCAQRETKDQNLELSRQANVRPVETWIKLLGRNQSLRLHHLSTGFVGKVKADQLHGTGRFGRSGIQAGNVLRDG